MSYYEIENLFMAGFMVNGMQFICFRYVESLEYGLSVDTTFHAKIGSRDYADIIVIDGARYDIDGFLFDGRSYRSLCGYKDSVRYGSFSRCSNCYTDGGKS